MAMALDHRHQEIPQMGADAEHFQVLYSPPEIVMPPKCETHVAYVEQKFEWTKVSVCVVEVMNPQLQHFLAVFESTL